MTSTHSSIDFILIGGLRQDTLITPDGRVYRGQIGGNAAFAAAGARQWGARPGIISRAGENYPGEWYRAFAAAGIDTRGVRCVPGTHDMRTFYAYLSHEVRDDRDPAAHFARIGQPLPPELEGYDTSTSGQQDLAQWAPLAVRPEDIPAAYAGARGAHIAPSHVLTQAQLPAALRACGVPLVTLDPGERLALPGQERALDEVLAQVDVFLPSEQEVRSLWPGTPLWNAAENLAARGPAVVVIKIGARGQLVYERAARRRRHVPALPPAPFVDVTGAGDAYCGAFLVAYSRSGDALESALRGSVTAARVIGGVGALYALGRAEEDLQEEVDRLRTRVTE